jgi:HlyD family secretion protein
MAQTIPSPPGQVEPTEQRQRAARVRRILPVLLVLAGAGTAAWYFLARPKSNALEFSGRIEGYETDVGAKVAGRVMEVTVREGAEVQKGQLLVRLDDDTVRAQLQGAEAQLNSSQQQQENAKLQLAVVESQINQSQLRIQQSQGDTQGQVAQAQADVAAAVAQLKQAEAQVIDAQSQLKLAQLDSERFAKLVQDGAVTQQAYDQKQAAFQSAEATLNSRQAAVVAAQRQVNAAEGKLTQSQSTSLNPNINTAQLAGYQTQLKQAQAQLKQAVANVANAEAQRKQIQSQLQDLTINSPISGIVTARSVEPGVVVTAGKTLLTLLNLNTVYMRGFIPEGDIGQVRVGQEALVYLDSNPNQPLKARVAAIDSTASFTPENIYFKKDRVRQVFGVRLEITQPNGFAKPGMPADGKILEQK